MPLREVTYQIQRVTMMAAVTVPKAITATIKAQDASGTQSGAVSCTVAIETWTKRPARPPSPAVSRRASTRTLARRFWARSPRRRGRRYADHVPHLGRGGGQVHRRCQLGGARGQPRSRRVRRDRGPTIVEGTIAVPGWAGPTTGLHPTQKPTCAGPHGADIPQKCRRYIPVYVGYSQRGRAMSCQMVYKYTRRSYHGASRDPPDGRHRVADRGGRAGWPNPATVAVQVIARANGVDSTARTSRPSAT